MPFTRSNGSNNFAGKNNIPLNVPSTIFPTQGNYLGDSSGTLQNSSILQASKIAKGHVTASNVLTTKDNNGG